MTTDDYTDPTKWMELPPQQFPQTNFSKWEPFIPRECPNCGSKKEYAQGMGNANFNGPILVCPNYPKPQSLESGFDIED